MNNLLPCEIEGCDNLSRIRTKIKNKESEYYGSYVCSYHAGMHKAPRKISDKTRRTQEKRAQQRQDYPRFYQSEIEKAQGERCLECNKPINDPNSTNIVHVLAKSTSPEVATDPNNIIYLCSAHHTAFDRSLENRATMECFEEAKKRYLILKPKLVNITSETQQFEKII